MFNQAYTKDEQYVRRSVKLLFLIVVFFFTSPLISLAQYVPGNTPVGQCSLPIFAVTGKDVSSKNINDGQIIISGIKDATHYEVIAGETTNFNFAYATALDPGQIRVELKGLANPAGNTLYKIRLYNQNAGCYTEQSVHLSHINYAENLEYTQVELIQGVDNPTPQIGDIVTFTTLVQNKGSKTINTVEVTQILSKSLDIIYAYADMGNYNFIGNQWSVGNVVPGRTPKLVVRVKVTEEGLAYITSHISRANGYKLQYGESLPSQDGSLRIAATNCVTVPIAIKKDQVFNVSLASYKGLTWYYKDAAGNYAEINEYTNPAIAEINPDSSLSIKQGGEYTYTKKVEECTFSSCCPIILEGCKGPPIIVDSIYCNQNVDSYDIIVHLKNDSWNIIEKAFYSMNNLAFPILTNFLGRLGVLPITSSAGYVTSLGGGRYKISNVPAFMPNVTMVSTDIRGECRFIKIVNAPNCDLAYVPQPVLASAVEFYSPGSSMPALRVANAEKTLKTEWYLDELGTKRVSKGANFVPNETGKYYVAFVDKKSNARSVLVEAEVRALTESLPGEFVAVSVCDCENENMQNQGSRELYTTANIFPNPASDVAHINYSIPSNANTADVFVFSINGVQMATYSLNTNENELTFNVNNYNDGLYVYTVVVDGQKKITQRFVVRH